MVIKRIAALLILLLVGLTSVWGFAVSESKIASSDFFCGVLDCTSEDELEVVETQRGKVLLLYDTFSGYVIATKKVPRGFSSADEFASFGNNLNSGLKKAGFRDTQAIFQGSSVTGKSFRTGKPFDVGRRSDFDIALAGDGIFSKAQSLGIPLRSGGTRTGPLRASDLKKLGLSNLSSQLGSQAGRPVNFMIFQSPANATARAPSIVVP